MTRRPTFKHWLKFDKFYNTVKLTSQVVQSIKNNKMWALLTPVTISYLCLIAIYELLQYVPRESIY